MPAGMSLAICASALLVELVSEGSVNEESSLSEENSSTSISTYSLVTALCCWFLALVVQDLKWMLVQDFINNHVILKGNC